MDNPLFFTEGAWSAEGEYQEANTVMRASGLVEVAREAGGWRMRTVLVLEGRAGGLGETVCRYPEPPGGAESLAWTAENNLFGGFKGLFVLAANSVLSAGRSKDGELAVSEFHTCTGPHSCECRGSLLGPGGLSGAWRLDLRQR